MQVTKTLAAVCAAGAAMAAGSAQAALTYSKDVAPIMNQNCVVCHRAGASGPMSLATYEEVRPWVKAILKNVSENVMPPWHADKGYGPWKNDRSLSQDEIDTIVKWAKAGAPEGSKSDLPPPPSYPTGDWQLGEPDFVVNFNEVSLPASGNDEFYNLVGKTDFAEDKWISAVEIKPGDSKVVHHVILWQGSQGNPNGWIGAWAAGAGPQEFPEGTARLLKKGEPIVGDMHYHLYGEATKDQTKVGVHFIDKDKLKKELVNLWVMNADFRIPAGDPNYEATSTFTFGQDSTILTLTPHMHYRGKDFSYTLTLPDGTKRDLLKVSKYDFNWQTGYEFETPVDAPKGSRIDCVAHWDNSADNKANPDPKRDVTFGPQSYDEMMIGFVDYVVKDGVSPKPDNSVNPVIAKMQELAAAHPGEIFKVMIQQAEAKMEASALHIPKTGDGGWYVKFGSIVGKAIVSDIVWTGTSFTATAKIPGQDPMTISGTVEGETLKLNLPMGNGGQMITLPGTLVH
jgi:mono/diheme cytochrome c family protein